ncbi:amidohydrolase family protein [Sphingomonas baiyangensis]|uniref:Amidohydrolase family protein n=1 Tax=Sphingomonas baiyangensis TaxID=2572576 RepID=A0A4V5PTN1_9SPHN|nr:amidohydrolase family protein [Sphingomonas baiyangensis]TKD50748.1 amidohydrolase family protein [Sphingomonas baiyangensis]
MRRLTRWMTGAMAVAMLAPAASSAQEARPRVVALTGGNVVDIDTGRTTPDATVLIEGERIVAVGPAASVPVPAGAKMVPMAGRWLAPGLMNMHVHFGLKLPGAAGAELVNETDGAQALRMADNARRSLLAGVTTVRLTAEDRGLDFQLRRAINAGQAVGPRIESAGELIVPTGGHGSLEADGPAEFSKVVREQIKRGASWIKIAISGGISDTHGAIGAAPMTDAELSTVLDVAKRNGVKVTAHNGSSVAAMQALKFGIDCFEHGYHLNDQVLAEMKKQGTWLVPTIVVSQPGAYEFYRKIGSPPWYLDRVASVGKDHWAVLQKAIRLGVNVALGTDQFPYEPNSGTTATVHEAELYVKAGMTPLAALQAATIQPARMLGLDKQVGRIAPGQYADIVALDADPVQDIGALRSLDFVMKGGIVYRDDDNPAAIDRIDPQTGKVS